MMTDARPLAASAFVTALALTLAPPDANALILARVTRHGFILTDEPDSASPYEGHATVADNAGTFNILSDVTNAIVNIDGAPQAPYIALMQTTYENGGALAFYLGLINDTRGVGIRSPFGDSRETYDLNVAAGTVYPVTGFVFLNNFNFYVNPALENFGRYLICTQEFGHHYGTFVRVPQYPTAGSDAGVPDGGDPDAAPPDAGPPLANDALLGRQRAHWSYFVHTGGSPMEGNNWEEITPGVFRTGRLSFRFSTMDLYIMGLLPASAVDPFFLIADADVMGQRDQNGQTINRESPPEFGGRTITIRGRRVDVGIDDIVRANGPRIPAYEDPDASVPDDGGDASAPGDGGVHITRDLNVVWVLLAAPDEVNDGLAQAFDRAIESCTEGYDGASNQRSHLIAAVLPSDGGAGDASTDALVTDVVIRDAGTPDAFVSPDVDAVGGCGACSTPGHHTRGAAGALGTLGALAAVVATRRRRANRARA
jgi:hypothetical protein